MVIVGNGTDELVLIAAMTFASCGRMALVTESTFPGYVSAAAAVGARVLTTALKDYSISVDAVTSGLAGGVDVAFVCNPLNPTGSVLSSRDISRMISMAASTNSVVVFDEAYMDFAGPGHDHATEAVRSGSRVLVLRTFSKAWGLAGLRVGYAVGAPDLIERMRRTARTLPFNVNRVAQAAALAALKNPSYLKEIRERTVEAREVLFMRLHEELRVELVPSVTNFVLIKLNGDSDWVSSELSSRHRVLVRNLSSFGLEGCLRVSVGTLQQVHQFCVALSAILKHPTPWPRPPERFFET